MRGAEVYVLPDLRGMGPDILAAGSQDPLFRDTIVYLTCLHETGHALGLSHTADFADIMYFFGYDKGDIREYFGRYRRKLQRASGYREELGDLAAGSGEAYSGAEVAVVLGGGIASPRFNDPPPSLT